MTPDPTFDCSNPNFQVIYTACTAGDYTKCCAAGTSCCAGGCCDLVSNCINVGTANEACCPVSDPTVCGTAGNGSPGSGTTPPLAGQSVECEGANGLSAYFCPAGSTCNLSNDSCNPPESSSSAGSGSGSGSGSSRGAGTGSLVGSTRSTSSSEAEETGSSTTTEDSGESTTRTSDSGEETTTSTDENTTTSASDTSSPATVVVTTTATTATSTGGAPWVDTGLAYLYGSTVWGLVQLLI